MRLEPGLHLQLPPASFAAPRVWLNSGVEPVESEHYLPGAFAPRADWRPATPAELEELAGSGEPEPGCRVRVVAVPAAAEPLWRLGFDRVETEADYHALCGTRGFRPALAEAVAAAAPLHRPDGEPTVLGVSFKPPGLRTVTVHPACGRFVGLHLDRWDRRPLADRGQSRTRLCVNLGREPRAFEYVNLPLRRVLELGDGDPSGLTEADGWQRAIGGFLRRFPDYPVVRLLVGPGEGYVAPTENFIHDGCTAGRATPDLCLNLVGHFTA